MSAARAINALLMRIRTHVKACSKAQRRFVRECQCRIEQDLDLPEDTQARLEHILDDLDDQAGVERSKYETADWDDDY
jgi:hypothetical protein